MPEISRFYGIIIAMFAKDHPPPHFHAKYNEFLCVIEIRTGRIVRGELPKRAQRLVEEWRKMHMNELMNNWEAAQSDSPVFSKIEPLD